MENLDPIDVQFLINSQQVKQDAAEVRKEIGGTADAIEKATSKASDKISKDFQEVALEAQTATNKLVSLELEVKKLTEANKVLTKGYDAGTISQDEYLRNAELIKNKLIPLRQEIKGLNADLSKQGQSVASLKPQFNGLGNSINQISRELPAFTFSAQTGFLAISNNLPILVDEINRLKVANAAAAASGAATIPIWTAIRAVLFSWMTVITLAITALTLFGPKLWEMAKNLFATKKAIDDVKASQEAMNKAFESSEVKDAIDTVVDLKSMVDLAKQGLIEKETVVKKYNETMGKATKELKDFHEVEKSIEANADAYIEATLKKAGAEAARAAAVGKLQEAYKDQFEAEQDLIDAEKKLEIEKKRGLVMSGTGASSNISSAEQAVKNANYQLQQTEKRITEIGVTAQKVISKFAQESVKTGQNLYDDNDPDKPKEASVLDSRQQLLDKIAALDAEYARKRFTKDEEEVQALRDKFAKVRELVERFNNDPRNKAKRIDVSGLDASEEGAVSDLTYRQQTAGMIREIAEQKKIFQEFETYKVQFGEAKAKEQYAGQIGEYDNFIDFLRSKVNQNQDVYEAVSGGAATGPQSERFDALQKALESETKEVQNHFNKLLKDNQDLQTKLALMEEQYNAKRLQLLAAGQTEAAEVLRLGHEKQVNDLLDSHIKQLDAYKALFAGISRLSDANAVKVIANARKMLSTATGLTEEQRKQIESKIADMELSLEDRNLDRIDRAAQSFAQLSRELGGINTGLGAMLGIIGQVASSSVAIKDNLSALKDGIANYKDQRAGKGVQGALGTIGAVAGVAGPAGQIVAAVAQTVNAVIGYFKGLKKAKEDAKRAVEDFYRTAEEGEMKYAALIRQRELQSVSRGKSSYKAIIAQLDMLKDQAPEIQEAYDKVFAALQGGEFASGIAGRHGTWLRKAKTWDVMASLAGSDYERLEKLYTQGKLSDAAKRDFEALRDLKEELEEAGIEVEDLQTKLNEMLTGTNASGLADSLTELFRNGKMATEDFAESFEEIMRNAIVNTFRYKYLEDAMQPFYDQLATLMGQGTPSQEQIDALKAQYEQIGKEAADTWKALEAATGISLSNPNQSEAQKGLAGGIRRELTEATGSELAGLFRGFYDVSKRGLVLNENRYLLERQHYEAMLTSINHQAAIEANTMRTADKVTEAVTELKIIVKQTKPVSGRDLGVGGP